MFILSIYIYFLSFAHIAKTGEVTSPLLPWYPYRPLPPSLPPTLPQTLNGIDTNLDRRTEAKAVRQTDRQVSDGATGAKDRGKVKVVQDIYL